MAQLADNTQYWLGEAYHVTQDYAQAAATFQRVLTCWPNARKAPMHAGSWAIRSWSRASSPPAAPPAAGGGEVSGSEPRACAAERLAKLPE